MFHKTSAFDRSEVGKHVFDEALSLAKATRASLMLLHVLSSYEEGYPLDMPLVSSLDYSGMQEEVVAIPRAVGSVQRARTKLTAIANREATAAGVDTEFIHTPGSPCHL